MGSTEAMTISYSFVFLTISESFHLITIPTRHFWILCFCEFTFDLSSKWKQKLVCLQLLRMCFFVFVFVFRIPLHQNRNRITIASNWAKSGQKLFFFHPESLATERNTEQISFFSLSQTAFDFTITIGNLQSAKVCFVFF